MSSRRDYDDRDDYRSRSRLAGNSREADDYDSHRKRSPPRRADSRSRRSNSGGHGRDDSDYRRSDRRDDDRGRGRDDDRRDDDRGRGRDDDRRDDRYSDRSRGRGRDESDYRRSDRRDDDRGRGRDDDRRDDDRGRGRGDDRGRGRDRDDGRNKKKTGWGDEDKEKEAPPDWLADLVGGSSADKMPPPVTVESFGGGLGAPPPPGTRLNCKTIQIPVDAKPYLIGKQGSVINEIRAKTQSMIQINNNGPGDKTVTVMITGNVDAVEKLIHQHLDGWFTPSSNAPKPNEAVLEQIRVGKVAPTMLAPPVQLSAANIWNWNS